MKQAISAKPFVSAILTRPSASLAGQWSALADGAPIAKPAARRVAGGSPATLSLNIVRSIAQLLDGSAEVRFVSAADPAIIAEVTTQGSTESLLYRTRAEQIYTVAATPQSLSSSVLFAARLLVNRVPDLSAAYLALLQAVAAKAPQTDLDTLMATACDELVVAFIEDLALEDTPSRATWFYGVKPAEDFISEFEDQAALALKGLLTDPVMFEKYLKGEPTPYTNVERVPGTASTIGATPVNIGAADFIGEQLDVSVKYAKRGKHILYHGPTGTGKSFLWEIIMREVDGEGFDADTYPYFVHGSGGLEDIDFVGQAILDKDGNRRWVDGPLVRAMEDGKRFKVEEMNRLPGPMLNVLLGAMDYGRIYVPALGKMVVAAEGFAVDAMANIGREYTATEEIDPAVLRRFQIKVAFDFLSADNEVMLLRSRYPTLKPEAAETLVGIANMIRQAYEEGSGTVDVDMYVSPAALLNSAELVAEGTDIMEAIDLTWLADVAWTKAKRESVKGVIELKVRENKRSRRSVNKP